MRCRTVSDSAVPTVVSFSRDIRDNRTRVDVEFTAAFRYKRIVMKIIVAIKQVPARDSQLRIAASGKWIEESDVAYEINEPDAYALEAALQLKEKNGGEVIALCAAPERASQTIREALAKGADRAIHIEEDMSAFDPLAAARLLAAAIRTESPDMVLTGL